MKDDIRSRSAEELRDLSRDCTEMIKTVCIRLSSDDEMEAGVRRLMRSEDLLAEFAAVESEDRETALRILNAALATLVNSHSVLAIEVEFERRVREKNYARVYFLPFRRCIMAATVGEHPAEGTSG